MLCEKCQKKDANVSVQTMINGITESHHLCSECAQQEGLFYSGFGLENLSMANNIGKTLFNFPYSKLGHAQNNSDALLGTKMTCPHCNQSLSDFKQTGLFGCPQCYESFRGMIREMLDQVQGDHLHRDSRRITQDKSDSSDSPILVIEDKQETSEQTAQEKLKAELQEMIKQENYEQAAIIRDRIKELEKEDQVDESE